MSEIRVGVAAEGPTDIVVIQAALDKILDVPFVITQLQPETSEGLSDNLFGRRGAGWGGVYQWCRQVCLATSHVRRRAIQFKIWKQLSLAG